MLTRVSFENFKNLRKVDVDLSPFTVLVGPNGAGKTSVLQGIYLITEVIQRLARVSQTKNARKEPLLETTFSGRFAPDRLVTNGKHLLKITLLEDTPELSIALQARSQHPDTDSFSLDVSGRRIDLTNGSSENLRKFGLSRLASVPPSMLLQLDPGRMVRPSVVEEAEPKLAPNGEGLASVLSYLAGAHPERKEAIETDTAAIVPWFRRVRITPTKVSRLVTRPFPVGHEAVQVPVGEEVWGHQFSIESIDGTVVPADLVSEGTVLVLGLLTLLHDPNPPRLLLVDDIDRALHLGAQVRLIRLLRALQEKRPELQIVASTHSPFLLQEFSADDVRVLGLAKDGVHCRTLSAHPDYAKWKSVLGTGEIWANLGEEWVGDGV